MDNAQSRWTRIYSRGGDLGETSMSFGPRVGKDHLRMVALGSVDELCAWLGWARCEDLDPQTSALIKRLQLRLFALGTEISSLEPEKAGVRTVGDDDVKGLERAIDFWSAKIDETKGFVVPGDVKGATALHVARSVCRRVERRTVALLRFDPKFSPKVVSWFNRLGDLLFVLARFEYLRLSTRESFVSLKDAYDDFDKELT